ncbi:hypothetical protein LMG23992_04168 [Cupriavidus laharis]|uniref:Uncharacterized protein n=1 Tax=Cupriavidus laharis TaxID=151654 RepID=A0ABN7Z4R3_9BURK|nr:hypothetical protein [Cupriavidus laharis]CAG9180203.1 hypothetical protein LMG23992_04168 [Cupriavidus laharis]
MPNPTTTPLYGYEIAPRLAESGGGFRLRLLQDGVEVGGGIFPADPDADPQAGMAWFNALTELERAEWVARADSARPSEAWAAF